MSNQEPWPFLSASERVHEPVWSVRDCDSGVIPVRYVVYEQAHQLATRLLQHGSRRVWVYPEDELRAAENQLGEFAY